MWRTMSVVAGVSSAVAAALLLFARPFIKFVFTLKDNLSIRNVALVCLCAIAPASAQSPPPPAPTPSIVWAAHDSDAITDYRPNSKVVRTMVDRLLLSVTGQNEAATALTSPG